MQKIRIGDEVIVLSGKDKGKTGKVLKYFKKQRSVQVEGVNEAKRATKPNQINSTGGFVSKFLPLNVSKVALYSQAKSAASRVSIVKSAKNKNQRVLKICKTVLN